MGVWRELYGHEPEAPPAYTPDWNERHWRRGDEPLLTAAQRHLHQRPELDFEAGDVLIFRVAQDGPAKHCAIACDTDRFIHAYAGRAVVETWMNRWWRAHLVGVFSFPGAA